ncbi:MAG: zinc-ribbon domain-containing protein [Oscillospiraceae bacterium]|nr:zinc-ribbon domain-containing protein [Oscillospiraceae bacterium]
MYCIKCGAQIEDNATFCSVCGASQTESLQPTIKEEACQQTMKWFKFLIYFSLFASAVLNFISGVQMLTGSIYGADADLVYAFFDGLKALDVLMGVGMLALAAFAIYTRFRLSGFYKNGPKMVMLTYAIDAALQLIYIIGVNVILPGEVVAEIDMTSTIVGIVVSVVMIWANKVYFDKRANLFQN